MVFCRPSIPVTVVMEAIILIARMVIYFLDMFAASFEKKNVDFVIRLGGGGG